MTLQHSPLLSFARGTRSLLCLVLALAAVFAWTTPAEGAVLPIDTFFSQAREAQDALPPFACDVETQEYFGYGEHAAPSDEPEQKTVYHVRSSGELLDIVSTLYAPDPDTGAMLIPVMNARAYWDGALFWRTTEVVNQDEAISAQVDENAYNIQRQRANPNAGAFLDGWFMHNYDGDWVTLLSQEPSARLEPQLETVDGYACYVLRAETQHGEYRLWVDADHGYRLRRGEIVVERGQQAWGAPLQQASMSTPGRSFERFEMELRDVSVQEISGHWFATAGTFTHRFRYSDGSLSSDTLLVKRENLQVEPDFEGMGAFKVALANGSLVEYMFTNGAVLDYRWQDGVLEPIVDEITLAQIEQSVSEMQSRADQAGTLASMSAERLNTVAPGSAFLSALGATLNLFQSVWIFAALLLLLAVAGSVPPVRRWLIQ